LRGLQDRRSMSKEESKRCYCGEETLLHSLTSNSGRSWLTGQGPTI
jgi:hypothetical protein